MAQPNDGWFLSHEEHVSLWEKGVNSALAERVGAADRQVRILSARNIEHQTIDGVYGFMQVSIEWTTADKRWHYRNLRFNGENPIDLPEEHLAELGAVACARPTEVRDFTRDMYGLPLQRVLPDLQVVQAPVEMPVASPEAQAA